MLELPALSCLILKPLPALALLCVIVCPASLVPCALGGLSALGTCSSTGQAAERLEPVGSVGAGKEAPGCFGKQEDWETLLECGRGKAFPTHVLERGTLTQLPAPNLCPTSSHFLVLGRSGGPWGSTWVCVSRGPEGWLLKFPGCLCSTLQRILPPSSGGRRPGGAGRGSGGGEKGLPSRA